MVVEYPNVVEYLVDYLQTALATAYPTVVVTDFYRGQPVCVWVQRDGGPGLDLLREAARIRINCYHSAAGSASKPVDDLARRVSTLIRACPNGQPVVRAVQTSGPASIADTVPRRLLGFELVVRGS